MNGVFKDPSVISLTNWWEEKDWESVNHRSGEDYEKYWHLRETDYKNIDDFVPPGSQKTPFMRNRVKQIESINPTSIWIVLKS